MSDFSGRLVPYGIAIETVRGTAVAPQFWVRWESNDMLDKGTTVLNQSALNVLDKYSGAELTQQWAEGTIGGKVTDHTIGAILFGLFGSYSKATHSGETTVYDHLFTESQLNACPSLTITRVDPNVTNQYTKAMLKSFDLDVKAGDFVRHSTAFVANPSQTASTTVTYTNEQEFIAKHVSVTFGGGGAIPVASLKLTVSKNTNPYWIIGQNNPGDIFAESVEIKGEMVLRYSDQTYYQLMFPSNSVKTPQAVVIDIVNSGVVLGSAAHPELKFSMPQCYVNEWKAEQSLDGMVQQTVDFEATYSLTTGYAIQGTLTNMHTQYSPAGIS